MVTLGKEYKDSLTGFRGIAVARTTFCTGCVHILLLPKTLAKDGSVRDGEWFDESRVDPESAAAVGGPADQPPVQSSGKGG